jgi:HEAT repeat protein
VQLGAVPEPAATAEELDGVLARVALTDPALEVQGLAAALLARRGERAIPVLERLLQSPDRRLRLLALRCAVVPGATPLPKALLQRAQQDADGYVREEARRLSAR